MHVNLKVLRYLGLSQTCYFLLFICAFKDIDQFVM